MRLVVVSHTAHYRQGDTLVGWGPTIREIDHLAELFEQVTHIAPLHAGPAPASAIAYQSPRVALRAVPPAGGPRLADKLAVLHRAPAYLWAMLDELRGADVVHVRCPASISLIALLLLALTRRPPLRWVKYAGNWHPAGGEAWSNCLQRRWLRQNLHRGVVTVNGTWPGQPPHVHTFLNPCLTARELAEAQRLAAGKQMSTPLRLITVGRLSAEKGIPVVLRTLAALHKAGLAVTCTLIGDGDERAEFEAQVRALGIEGLVCFKGWLAREALAAHYAAAHVMLLPSQSEGWPKVLSEGMAYGVVPVASQVGSIPQILRRCGVGKTLPPGDVAGFADAIIGYASQPEMWKAEVERSQKAAQQFSYDAYLQAVQGMLGL